MMSYTRLPRFFGLHFRCLFFAKKSFKGKLSQSTACYSVFLGCLQSSMMDWWYCAINRKRTDTTEKTCSWFYVGSGNKVTVCSRLTLMSSFKPSDIRGTNYKWCIYPQEKTLLDVVNFTIYVVEGALLIALLRIQYCATWKELFSFLFRSILKRKSLQYHQTFLIRYYNYILIHIGFFL